VLFVGGFGRSGSSLLDRAMGGLPGFASLGEVKYLWTRGLIGNELCGCGEPFRACPFWTAVGERGFGGWDRVDVAEVIAGLARADRHRYVPALMFRGPRTAFGRDLARTTGVLSRLYAAIRDVADARVLVDSSVDPSTALLLRRVPDLDLHVAHLVRDSRGVARSWAKRIVRPEVVGETSYMHAYRPASTAVRWDVDNGLYEWIRRSGVPTERVRYEDFVSAPRTTIAALARLLDEPASDDDLRFAGDGWIELDTDHTVAGNPMRFRTGRIELRLDDEWRTGMPVASRFAVSALSWPLLRRYGYGRHRT
jgi:hypothetical protein